MAGSKLLVASIAIALVIVGVRSDASIGGEIGESAASRSALRSEIVELQSKISILESSIEDRIREIKNKEDNIGQLNAIIQEKLSSIASLENEIESLQKKGSVDVKELDGKADARVRELEKQIAKLRTGIEVQSEKRDALTSRASEAEKRIQELYLRLESLQRTNEEQKLRIRKSQRALELAEEELMRAQLESSSKSKVLNKVHEAWLPPWLATYINHIQEITVTQWNEHVKPAVILMLHKASEKLDQAREWAEPHFNSAKTEWIPAAKEQFFLFKSNAQPHLKKAYAKTFEVYEASKRTVAPQIIRLHNVAYPYFEEARAFSKPYIDEIVVLAKPHAEKLRLVMKPYTKHVARAYRKSLRRAIAYHLQVQENIHEQLKKHKLTNPYASQELARFMASALFVFVIVFLYRVLSAAFCKKAKKPRRTAHTSHSHRRAKRRHAEK